MRSVHSITVTVISLLPVASVCAGGVAYFRGVGDLPGGPRGSRAYGISPDGSTLVGQSE
jgi:hypothetical protein